MRAEDVPGEWVEAAGKALWAAGNKPSQMAHAIAAVYPLIAKAERERCARVADDLTVGEIDWQHIAAAIRALGDGEVGG